MTCYDYENLCKFQAVSGVEIEVEAHATDAKFAWCVIGGTEFYLSKSDVRKLKKALKRAEKMIKDDNEVD
jgi:hypothetical protein